MLQHFRMSTDGLIIYVTSDTEGSKASFRVYAGHCHPGDTCELARCSIEDLQITGGRPIIQFWHQYRLRTFDPSDYAGWGYLNPNNYDILANLENATIGLRVGSPGRIPRYLCCYDSNLVYLSHGLDGSPGSYRLLRGHLDKPLTEQTRATIEAGELEITVLNVLGGSKLVLPIQSLYHPRLIIGTPRRAIYPKRLPFEHYDIKETDEHTIIRPR